MRGSPRSNCSMQFWFDFASTYSYVAALRVQPLCDEAGVSVEYKPFWQAVPVKINRGLDHRHLTFLVPDRHRAKTPQLVEKLQPRFELLYLKGARFGFQLFSYGLLLAGLAATGTGVEARQLAYQIVVRDSSGPPAAEAPGQEERIA